MLARHPDLVRIAYGVGEIMKFWVFVCLLIVAAVPVATAAGQNCKLPKLASLEMLPLQKGEIAVAVQLQGKDKRT